MKKGKIAGRLLTIILSAAMVVTSLDGSLLMVSAQAETVSENKITEADDLTDGAGQETASEAENAEDVQEASSEQTAPAKESETEETETTETETAETETEEDKEDDAVDTEEEEEVAVEKIELADTTPVNATLIPDAELRKALLDIYNTQYSQNITADAFRGVHLKAITKIDLSTYNDTSKVNVNNIKSVEGLKYVLNATYVDISTTSVKEIVDEGFKDQVKLQTIVLPDGLQKIGKLAFDACTSLKKVQVQKDGANTLPSGLVSKGVGENTFRGCAALTNMTIPCNTTALESALSMFSGCTGLTSVTIGKNLTVIPTEMFRNAGDKDSGITLTIESGSALTSIGRDAFRKANISKVDLSNCTKLGVIGDGAFSRMDSRTSNQASDKYITELILPATDKCTGGLELGDELFYNTPVDKIYPAGTESVESGTVILPDYVTKLGNAAFFGDGSIKKVTLSAKLEGIEGYTFYKCTNLSNVTTSTITNGGTRDSAIKFIDDQAFAETAALTDATFIGDMNHLTQIGERKLETKYEKVSNREYKYYATEKLTETAEFRSDVFYKSGITKITLPASLRIIGSHAFYQDENAGKLTEVTWKSDATAPQAQTYQIYAGAFYNNTALTNFTYTKTATDNNTAFTIGMGAFAKCSNLSSFKADNATVNALPKTMAELGDEAFKGCASLTEMHITDNQKNQTPKLGKGCFEDCITLATAELPKSLTEVPSHFYYNAPVSNLIRGTSIVKIGDGAFFGNGMTTFDLSDQKNLAEIGSFALAYVDLSKNPVVLAANVILPPITPLTTVILPEKVDNMTLGTGVFCGAGKFTTLQRKNSQYNAAGKVLMPDYIKNSGISGNLFASTGVTHVIWEYEKTGSSNKWNTIPPAMFNATPITDIKNVLFADANSLKAIGKGAFLGCENLTAIDLSVYPNLEKIEESTFANCMNVKQIKLPNNGKYTKVQPNTFRIGVYSDVKLAWTDPEAVYSSLQTIDFGGVTELGTYSFGCFSDAASGAIAANTVHNAKLQTLDFSKSSVKTIGSSAFKGQQALKTVSFTGVEDIGNNSFELCKSLVMTDKPMADSVKRIGSSAFAKCENIGAVIFGSGLEKIEGSAFKECALISEDKKSMTEDTGLTALDFSKAEKLTEIGGDAFAHTALKDFTLEVPKVSVLQTGVVSNCPYLKSISLGDNVKLVSANVAYGCTLLEKVTFASTTTMDKNAFNNEGAYADSLNNNNKLTPIKSNSGRNSGNVIFKCKTDELTIAKGRVTKFPYYVTKYENGTDLKLGKICIGDEQSSNDVYKYVRAEAYSEGYYVKNREAASRIDNYVASSYKNYYVEVPESQLDTMKYKTEAGVEVVTFDLYGLELTPAGQSIPFSIESSFKFNSKNETVSCTINADYKLKVEDIPYHAVLYTDRDRKVLEDMTTYNQTTGQATIVKPLRANKKNPGGSVKYYYNIENVKASNTRPDNCNLIIESSDPAILSVGGNAKLVANTTNQWKITTAAYSLNAANPTAITNGLSFDLIPKKSGSVVVKVYPEGSPQQTITMNLNVVADINSVRLSVPRDFSGGVHVGDTFNIIESIGMYLNQSVSRDKGTLGTLSQYTDNVISFTSSDPNILAVDQAGNVTVVSVTKDKQKVTISCVVKLSVDEELTTNLKDYGVSYPPLKGGAEMTDASGATVKVTGTPNGTKPGTVTYTKPAPGVATVEIPSQVVVDGAVCDVTAIDKDAFKKNTTITKVTVKANVKEISDEMFYGCTNLTSVSLPKTVETIGKKAFMNCKKLKTVSISSTAATTTIGEYAFKGCASLPKITVPKNVTTIKAGAFMNCAKLKTVTFHKKAALTTIEKNAFNGCKLLAKITIPAKVTTIGAGALAKCAKLKAITVKTKVLKTVGKNALKGIYKKAVISVPRKNLANYKTLFAKKGQAKTVRIK